MELWLGSRMIHSVFHSVSSASSKSFTLAWSSDVEEADKTIRRTQRANSPTLVGLLTLSYLLFVLSASLMVDLMVFL